MYLTKTQPKMNSSPCVPLETAVVKEEQSNTQAIVTPEDKAEELTIVDLTEGEIAISTKTSIESLDEPPNENNNNNNTGVKGIRKVSYIFIM